MLVFALQSALAAFFFFVAVPSLARRYGDNVAARYYERKFDYTATCDGDVEARKFVAASKAPKCLRDFAMFQKDAAAAYVFPVMFPFDLVMMLFLAGALVTGALLFGAHVPYAPAQGWLVLILPIAYLATDFSEDVMLAYLLKVPDAITDNRVLVLKGLSILKMATLTLSLVEVAALAVMAGSQPWKIALGWL